MGGDHAADAALRHSAIGEFGGSKRAPLTSRPSAGRNLVALSSTLQAIARRVRWSHGMVRRLGFVNIPTEAVYWFVGLVIVVSLIISWVRRRHHARVRLRRWSATPSCSCRRHRRPRPVEPVRPAHEQTDPIVIAAVCVGSAFGLILSLALPGASSPEPPGLDHETDGVVGWALPHLAAMHHDRLATLSPYVRAPARDRSRMTLAARLRTSAAPSATSPGSSAPMRATPRPPSPTCSTAATWPRGRPACRSPSICRPRPATTPTTCWRAARWARWACPSPISATCGRCSTTSRSPR